ncbi:Uncharacterized protein PIL02S_03359 [Paenibacillus illinoisensis]|uniref:Uncharacterized protein n=1 Tax=Paenibacillus illinoisensis TaxID=59845 RepID=A0A2W0C672_9BACL|nr:Uncharacterized protein PIL02S_03359 [Paenibacillus illinoisensis]
MYEQQLDESDLVPTQNEEGATHVKILHCLRNVPVTIGETYELHLKQYDDCAAVEEELYIIDDNGKENHTFWICCKKEFFTSNK